MMALSSSSISTSIFSRSRSTLLNSSTFLEIQSVSKRLCHVKTFKFSPNSCSRGFF
ncbi:hypothetical protein HanRHA438_Chr12g0555241 [Helianthus annuus]|nr:hypothetical protein HanRHA438_Chr12g0555241 [Helianthus annuus]